MLVWFAACGVIVVALVFDSRGVDYRFVAAGSVLPLAETVTGSAWLMHTLTGGVALLAVTMAATAGRGKRLRRRRWLGLPIGSLIFLVASGVWQRSELFWWPWLGFDAVGAPPPEFDRPVGLLVAMEAAGFAALLLLARSRGLRDPHLRRLLLRTGRLPPPRR